MCADVLTVWTSFNERIHCCYFDHRKLPPKACFPLGKFVRANREKSNLIGWRRTLTTSPADHIRFAYSHKKNRPVENGLNVRYGYTQVDYAPFPHSGHTLNIIATPCMSLLISISKH